MAVTIRDIKDRIIERTLKILEEKKEEESESSSISADGSNTLLDTDRSAEKKEVTQLKSLTHLQTSNIASKANKNANFKFENYTGANIKFSVSNNDLDDNQNFKDKEVYGLKKLSIISKSGMNDARKFLHVAEIAGDRYNLDVEKHSMSKDIKFF